MSRARTEPPARRVELLWFQDCPNHPAAMVLLTELLGELAPGTAVHEIDATEPAVAQRHRFPGSPTIRVDGRDVAPSFEDPGCHLGEPRPPWPVAVIPWAALPI